MIIKWKDEYSCYDPVVDQQHKKLIDMINEINEIASLDDGYDRYDELVCIFNELKEYTVYHFGYEEKLFEQYHYDSFHTKIHQLEHKSFVNKAAAINLYDLDENQQESVIKVLDFLSIWLEHHILEVDLEFGKFLKEAKSKE